MTKTKREYFSTLLQIVADNAELVDFINHEIELLDRKASTPKKPTATQVANEGFKSDILITLSSADAPMTIKEITASTASLADASCQKVTHLLSDLVKAGLVVKTYEKKVPYFSIA